MKKYRVAVAMGGGFGGIQYGDSGIPYNSQIIELSGEEEVLNVLTDMEYEEYQSYEGYHGVLDEEECDKEGVSYDEEVTNWIETYYKELIPHFAIYYKNWADEFDYPIVVCATDEEIIWAKTEIENDKDLNDLEICFGSNECFELTKTELLDMLSSTKQIESEELELLDKFKIICKENNDIGYQPVHGVDLVEFLKDLYEYTEGE